MPIELTPAAFLSEIGKPQFKAWMSELYEFELLTAADSERTVQAYIVAYFMFQMGEGKIFHKKRIYVEKTLSTSMGNKSPDIHLKNSNGGTSLWLELKVYTENGPKINDKGLNKDFESLNCGLQAGAEAVMLIIHSKGIECEDVAETIAKKKSPEHYESIKRKFVQVVIE
jgi:hypothetical protein